MVMRIKELREARDMSQAQLANSMGVIRTAVANWESEIALPKARDLPHLAMVLSCSINDLFVQADDEAC